MLSVTFAVGRSVTISTSVKAVNTLHGAGVSVSVHGRGGTYGPPRLQEVLECGRSVTMSQPDAWRMIRRRGAAAGITAEIGCHAFRATGITAYLSNGAALEHEQEMAAHESPRTAKLYDRTKERLT